MEIWRNSGRGVSTAIISDRVGDRDHVTAQVSLTANMFV